MPHSLLAKCRGSKATYSIADSGMSAFSCESLSLSSDPAGDVGAFRGKYGANVLADRGKAVVHARSKAAGPSRVGCFVRGLC
jgi:hypothetical protein